jgi:hypothetical protein
MNKTDCNFDSFEYIYNGFWTDANTAAWWQVGWNLLLVHVGSCHTILSKDLNVHCTCHNIIPRMMAEENCDSHEESIASHLMQSLIHTFYERLPQITKSGFSHMITRVISNATL